MVQYKQHIMTIYKNGHEAEQIKFELECFNVDGYINRDFQKMYEDDEKVMFVLLYVRYGK